MNELHDMRLGIWRILRVALVVNAVCLLALYFYVRFVSPTASEVAVWFVPLLLLLNVVGALTYFNLFWFSTKLKKVNPGLARTLPRLFALSTLFLMFFTFLRNRFFTPQIVIGYFVAWLLLASLLNIVVHFRRRSG